MIEKINSIRRAIECECYLPALALALTLPDICGQIEYPDFKRKDKNGKEFREGRRQYVAVMLYVVRFFTKATLS